MKTDTSLTDLSFLNRLNTAQREAVEYIDGPSLVIAGAGSGKTMVLTYKIAYLMAEGMMPQRILALTFTNKAAKEMKDRIAQLAGEQMTRSLWMGTFHSIFNRILRRECEKIGYRPQYTIYQTSDSVSMIKSIIKDLSLDDKEYKPGVVQARISEAKNSLVLPEDYANNQEYYRRDKNAGMPKLAEIYHLYCDRCRYANVMDFDDLLLLTYLLFERYPEVRRLYSERFGYILVDEYQDTNYVQHKILMQLAEVNQRVCAVGDDAQSIYSFRGAQIDNILNFTHIYSQARLFKLEQNYRSTQTIVSAANSLIAKNKFQIPKQIFSKNEEGTPIYLYRSFSDIEEGEMVCREIRRMNQLMHVPYNQITVLYRTNAQSRIFEENLRKQGIPYRIYGGLSFYDQKDVKDVLAYFRLIVNPDDEEAFKRIVNNSLKGIGKTTLEKLIREATDNGCSIWKVMGQLDSLSCKIQSGTRRKLQDFYRMIESLRSSEEDAYKVGMRVFNESGIKEDAYKDSSKESLEKQNLMSELLNALSTFVDTQREEGQIDHISMADYLSEVSLLSTVDEGNDVEEKGEGMQENVSLMTVHASKGLEFDVVFIVGLEESLFPSQMTSYSQKEMEEERRLMYVALTRSRKRCYMTCARSRMRYGTIDFYEPSRFLSEIDSRYIKDLTGNPFGFKSALSLGGQSTEKSEKMSAVRPSVSAIRVSPPVESSEPVVQVKVGGMVLQAGMLVEHARFGEGKVLAVNGDTDNAIATIAFRNVGEKKLLLKYAKLTVKQ